MATTTAYLGCNQVFGWDPSWMIEQYTFNVIRRTDPESTIFGFRKFDRKDLLKKLRIARENGDITTMIELEAQIAGKM